MLGAVGQTGIVAADGPPFIARLPQGTIELVGVTEDFRPTLRSWWWRPDGSVTPIGRFRAQQKYHHPRVRAYEKIRTFLVRFENLPDVASINPVGGVNSSTTAAGIWPARRNSNWVAGAGTNPRYPAQFFTGDPKWDAGTHLWHATSVYYGEDAQSVLALRKKTPPPQTRATGQTDSLADTPPHFYRMFATVFAEPAQTTDLRVGIAVDPWETVASRKPDEVGRSTFKRNGREWVMSFRKAKTVKDTTRITVTSPIATYGQWSKRLVAVAYDGSEHAAIWSGNLDGTHGEFCFYGLPLPAIDELRLQVRPLRCVEFDNISLQPGQNTHVTVVSSDDSADDSAKEQQRNDRGNGAGF